MKILISGAGGYLGQYLTKELLKDGHKVEAVYNNKHNTIAINNDNLNYNEHFIDLTNEIDLIKYEKLINSTSIDVYICAHAKQPNYAYSLDWTTKQIYDVFNVNIISIINSINLMLKTFVRKKNGQLIFISSNTVTWGGGDNNKFYYLSKKTIEDYLLSLIYKMSFSNIKINIVRLGLLEGGASSNVNGFDLEKYKKRINKIPNNKPVSLEDVKIAINYLLNNKLNLTGQIVRLANGE